MPEIFSRAISYADYDPKKLELYLTFKSGKEYTYFGVPENVYNELINSAFKGTYYNQYIRDV